MISNSNASWEWRRARSCNNDLATCVEVAFHDGVVSVRSSQQKAGPVVTFTTSEWRIFLEGVRAQEFDLPPEASSS